MKNEFQAVIDKAVKIATDSALAGKPIKRLVWYPPVVASQDPMGAFMVEYQPAKKSGSDS